MAPNTDNPAASPRSLSGVLSSPRAQRRGLWISAAVFLVGVAVFLAVFFSTRSGTNTVSPPAATAPLVTTPKAKSKPKVHIPPSPAAIALGRKFIEEGVAGKNLPAAYALADGAALGGVTKKQWDKGVSAITHYPAGNAMTTHFQVISSTPTAEMFQVGLVAAKGHAEGPVQFDIGLKRAGGRSTGRWLVDYWQPYYVIGIKQSPGGH